MAFGTDGTTTWKTKGVLRLAAIVAFGASCLCGQQYPFVAIPNAPKGPGALLEDSKGRLWVGSTDDVQMFDGERFYSLRAFGFPEVGVESIAEDATGAIWIGAEDGLYRWSGERVKRIVQGLTVKVGAIGRDYVIAAVHPDGEATLPANEEYQLFRVSIRENGSPERLPQRLNNFSIDAEGAALYVCGNGWCELSAQTIANWQTGQEFKPVRHAVTGTGEFDGRVFRDHAGCVWLRDQGAASYQCPGDAQFQRLPNEVASSSGPAFVGETRSGQILLPSDSVMAIGRPGDFRVIRAGNGYPSGLEMVEAPDGSIWMSAANGLYRLASPFRMEFWDQRSGLERPMTIVRLGSKVFAGSSQGIRMLSEDRTRWGELPKRPEVGHVFQLSAGPNGTLMANGQDLAMLTLDGTVLARVGKYIQGWRFIKTPDGTEWLAGAGVSRVTQKAATFSLIPEQMPIQHGSPVTIDMEYSATTRKMWTCVNGAGLLSRDNAGWSKPITMSDGLMENGCISLAPVANGDVWLGYYGPAYYAIVKIEPSGKVMVRNYKGATEFVDVDSRGWIWRGSDEGIVVAESAEAERERWLFPDGPGPNGTNQNAFFSDPDGSVWWAANHTIFHYSPPADLLRPRQTPKISIAGFSAGGGPPVIAEAVTPLAHGTSVTAHVGSLEFLRRSVLNLRYRVLPEQANWVESQSLDLPLGKLGAGEHSLELQARWFSGPWSGTVRRAFVVALPVWLSWPFVLSYAGIAFATAVTTYWYRRRQQKEAAQFPDLAAWRVNALLPELQDLNGSLLDGRFEVTSLIARGGFANIMDGYDHVQKRRCAVKIFRSEVSDKIWVQEQFEQEVSALRSIRHPNVVSIYSYGYTGAGLPYLVMEFIEGRSLREVLKEGAVPANRAHRFIEQISDALEAIHALNICHRDVKPENVMIRHEQSSIEEAVLIDFSIAIIKDADETLHGLSRAAGSFDYMAPEQAVGAGQASSDVYSLAKLIIEILTGQRVSKLLPNAALDLPQRVRDLKALREAGLSEDAMRLLAASLEFDPRNRPDSVKGLVDPIVRELAR